jgi:hypothetical protein
MSEPGEVQECLVDIGSPIIAYREPTVADQPRQRGQRGQRDSVRSTTHLCRPNRSLVPSPLLEMWLLMPRRRKTARRRGQP